MNVNALKKLDLTALKGKQAAYESSFGNIVQSDPWVEIKLRTKTMKLEYSYFAAQTIQRQYSKNIFAGELQMSDLGDMEVLVGVLHCGLITHQPDLTIEELGKEITLKHRVYYAHAISKAMEATQPNYDQLSDVLGDIQEMQGQLDELEAGNTTAPLPEIVPSPISGDLVE